MELGKINIDLLQSIINEINNSDLNKEVIQSPEIGVDCAVLDFGEEYIFVSTDPITGATNNIGELVIDVNANDVFASNGVPIGVVLTILLPVGSTEKYLRELMSDIYRKCKSMNISIIGGHTEVTDAVNRTVVSATILGKTTKRKLLKKQSLKPDYDIVLTKHIALEGTNILASDFEDVLKENLDPCEIEFAKNLSQFLSIKTDCEIAYSHSEDIYLHDVTEGGILGGIYEMFENSQVGFEIDIDRIPVLTVTKQICKIFDIDPYRLISSGSLIIGCKDGKSLVDKFEEFNVKASVIGRVTENKDKIIIKDGIERILESPQGDELFKVSREEKGI